MVVVTPGIDFLAVSSCFLSLPVFATIALGKLNERFGSGTTIPTRALILVGITSIPFIATFRVIKTRLRHKREAASMGAKMIPSNLGTRLGNADVLNTLQHNFLYGYPGMLSSF